MTTRTDTPSSVSERLDQIRTSSAERETAKAYLQQGAALADVMMQISGCARIIAHRVGRGVRGLLHMQA